MSNVQGSTQISQTPGKKSRNVEVACTRCKKRYYDSFGSCPFCPASPAAGGAPAAAAGAIPAPPEEAPPALQISSWAEECAEWQAIGDEISQGPDGGEPFIVTAHDVTQEQRRRMAARGERPMTYEEIVKDISDRQTSDRLVG